MKVLVDVAVNEAALAKLRASGFEVDVLSPPSEVARGPVEPERIREVEVLFCAHPPANFDEMRSLRWIQLSSTGYAQLFPFTLPSRGIKATNARGCFDVPIGEWVMAMMVNQVRDLRQMIRNQDQAVWDRGAVFQRELRGSTVGLWGYGGIGREVARLAKQMGVRVHVLTRSGEVKPRRQVYTVPGTGDVDGVLPDRVFSFADRERFLSELDFLVVAVPLTKSTEGVIGEAELKVMKRTAYLLNPARGPIVQEGALRRALTEGWIAGAALDTHYQYPLPAEHWLWRMPNVILTPHISGSSLSQRFGERLWDIFGQNLSRFSEARPLLNELSQSELLGH